MSEQQETHDIPVEEEMSGDENVWTEEIHIAGSELFNTLMSLVDEANIRRVIIKDSQGKQLVSVPLWLGIGAVAVMNIYSSLALIGAMMFGLSIVIERVEKMPEDLVDIEMAEG